MDYCLICGKVYCKQSFCRVCYRIGMIPGAYEYVLPYIICTACLVTTQVSRSRYMYWRRLFLQRIYVVICCVSVAINVMALFDAPVYLHIIFAALVVRYYM